MALGQHTHVPQNPQRKILEEELAFCVKQRRIDIWATEHEKRLHGEEKRADELGSGYAPAVRQSGRTVKHNCRKDMLRALYITEDNMGTRK